MKALAGIGLCSALAAQADDGVSWKFSGFGTIGAVVTDTDQAEFRSSMRQPRGATKSSPDLGVDSRLGLQGNVKFNDTFSAVGQVLTSRRDGTDAPEIEWLLAAVTPWLDVRPVAWCCLFPAVGHPQCRFVPNWLQKHWLYRQRRLTVLWRTCEQTEASTSSTTLHRPG
jgi:hypothetical protein